MALQPAKPFRVLVVVEGGCVRDVIAEQTDMPFEYITKDWDNLKEGAATEFLTEHMAEQSQFDPVFFNEIIEGVDDYADDDDEEVA